MDLQRRLVAMMLGALVCASAACVIHPFRGWSTADKAMFATFVGCQAVDTLQTANIRDNPALEEANPLYGKRPNMGVVLGTKAAIAVGAYHLFDRVETHRAATIILPTVLCGAVVVHNHRVGARLH